ncbi:competence protein CoiA [Streptomyces sp. NRRL S-37]|uniref:competence protein CoiA n=1 Tax=Streptomyces sp. NRRL S-37 TaxID=1463903 RepID=UPI001F1F6B9A|nr:competence protein CoiA [Streptomyces sp. NRRL S-37]
MQTAVIGSPNSGRAIILPTDADELLRWRRGHRASTYWCGTQLGGCGNELSDRLYRDKVCHFAHRPHTSCHRTATGANSADHLFLKDDLAAWTGRIGIKGRATSRNLGLGPGDAVDFRTGNGGQQHVRFQFSKLSHAEWTSMRDRLTREAATLDWVLGPSTVQPETVEELCDEYGYLLRFRFETHGAARHIRLRAEGPQNNTEWVPLRACAMTPEGLRVPGVKLRRRTSGLRPLDVAGIAAAPRSRGGQVRALREALINAARFRIRPTWEALCRTAGGDLLGVSPQDRAGLLIAVEQAGGEGAPLLSALLRTGEGEPPPYIREVVAAVAGGTPATTQVLKRWCQREADRAFAVYGMPSRTAPARLALTADGRIVAPRAKPPVQRTIVHVEARASVLEVTPLHEALRGARERRNERLVVGLLEQAEDSIVTLPKSEHINLLREMRTARDWLNSEVKKSKRKRRTLVSPQERAKRKGGILRDARPLPVLGKKSKKRKSS